MISCLVGFGVGLATTLTVLPLLNPRVRSTEQREATILKWLLTVSVLLTALVSGYALSATGFSRTATMGDLSLWERAHGYSLTKFWVGYGLATAGAWTGWLAWRRRMAPRSSHHAGAGEA